MVYFEQLRKQKAEISAQQQQSNAQMKQLAASLNLSDQEAADAFVLALAPPMIVRKRLPRVFGQRVSLVKDYSHKEQPQHVHTAVMQYFTVTTFS